MQSYEHKQNNMNKENNMTREIISVIERLLPWAVGKRGCYVNLAALISEFYQTHQNQQEPHPLEPAQMQQVINAYTAQENGDYLYGGWMEDRTHIWKGTYMDAQKKYIHLGVDITAPKGTSVCVPADGTVIHVSAAEGKDVDWGTNVAIQIDEYVFVFAHLARNSFVVPGRTIKAGTVLGSIGTWKRYENGNVFEHVHVQALSSVAYQKHMSEGFVHFDGYGCIGDEEKLKVENPEPIHLLAKFISQQL